MRVGKMVSCLALFAGILASAAADEGQVVKIGGIFCLSGEIASACNAIREGAEIGLDIVNKEGGINGKPLLLEIQDSKYTTKESHTLAVRFASDPSVLGVLITGIMETKAAAAVLERAKLTNITLWDSAPEIEALGEYAFGIGPWLPGTYERSAEYAYRVLGSRRAAIISTNNDWSLAVAAGFEQHLKQLGGGVLSSDSNIPNESDFRSMLARVLKSSPDLIYAPVTAHLIPFFRQLRELGFKGEIVTSDNLTDDLVGQAPEVFEGAYQSMVADPDTREAQRLKILYRQKFSRDAPMLVFHAWGYDGVRLMAEALRRSDLTRESVRETLLTIKDFPGANGAITLTPEGSWKMMVKIFQVRKGRLVRVER